MSAAVITTGQLTAAIRETVRYVDSLPDPTAAHHMGHAVDRLLMYLIAAMPDDAAREFITAAMPDDAASTHH